MRRKRLAVVGWAASIALAGWHGPVEACADIGNLVFFAPGSVQVNRDGEAALDDFVRDYQRQGPGASVLLVARSDTTGSQRRNLALSRRRGEAVRFYLAARGIPFDRVAIRANGERDLFSETPDGVSDRNNRIVHVFLMPGPDLAARGEQGPARC